ncbi:hypothetical protein T492DRAFT_857598, partial [Pavlovales sp. CCMP2436]
RVHVFSSFWLSKAANRAAARNGGAPVAGNGRLDRWLKNVDLFRKDLILVPVHDKARLHWSLAVVAFARECAWLHTEGGTPEEVDTLIGGGASATDADSNGEGVMPGARRSCSGEGRGCAACVLYLDSLGGSGQK